MSLQTPLFPGVVFDTSPNNPFTPESGFGSGPVPTVAGRNAIGNFGVIHFFDGNVLGTDWEQINVTFGTNQGLPHVGADIYGFSFNGLETAYVLPTTNNWGNAPAIGTITGIPLPLVRTVPAPDIGAGPVGLLALIVCLVAFNLLRYRRLFGAPRLA